MLNRAYTGPNRILHPRCTMGMGGHRFPSEVRGIHCGGKFCSRHLRIVWRGAWGEYSSGGNDFNHPCAGGDLFSNNFSDLASSLHLFADEPRMATDHADGEPCPDDPWPRKQTGFNGLLKREDGMIARSHIPHGRKPGFNRGFRMVGRFEQGIGWLFRLQSLYNISFSSQTEMDMTIDEPWNHGQATAVDTGRAVRDGHLIAWADCDNLRASHEECHVVAHGSCPIDEAHVMNGNRHNLPSHAIGMSRCLEPRTGSRYPPTSNPNFFKRV